MPHDRRWHELFVAEAVSIRLVAGEYIEDVVHFGSTSIPGAIAKPIIDMAGVVPELELPPVPLESLRRLGYGLDWVHILPDRICLTKGAPVTHHLYLVPHDSPTLKAWLQFRDVLRNSSALLTEYERLKSELAVFHPHNRMAYTEGKTAFIRRILEGEK